MVTPVEDLPLDLGLLDLGDFSDSWIASGATRSSLVSPRYLDLWLMTAIARLCSRVEAVCGVARYQGRMTEAVLVLPFRPSPRSNPRV